MTGAGGAAGTATFETARCRTSGCRCQVPRRARTSRFDHRYTSPSLPRAYPIVPVRGRGAAIEDIDGNLFLDFTAGIAVSATGYGEPAHHRGHHAPGQRADPLLARPTSTCPSTPSSPPSSTRSRRSTGRRAASSATRAPRPIETAIKLARFATGRQYLVAFLGGFHGRTYGAVTLTAVEVEVPHRFRPDAAGRLSRALRQRRASTSSSSASSSASSRPAISPRSSSSRSRARAAMSCPTTRSSRGCVRSATPTASCSSPTRSSRAQGAPARCGRSTTGTSSRTSSARRRGSRAGCR